MVLIINMNIKRRKSRQRERIYELLRTRKDHPTAQDVYARLKYEMPSLSLGNVYRNIAILLEEGRIRELGTHEELMESSPIYREIYDSQLGNGAISHD